MSNGRIDVDFMTRRRVLALMLPLAALAGCGGDTPPDGGMAKDTAGQQQQGIDTMKNFMESQKKGAKK
jgi:hypothetical protein